MSVLSSRQYRHRVLLYICFVNLSSGNMLNADMCYTYNSVEQRQLAYGCECCTCWQDWTCNWCSSEVNCNASCCRVCPALVWQPGLLVAQSPGCSYSFDCSADQLRQLLLIFHSAVCPLFLFQESIQEYFGATYVQTGAVLIAAAIVCAFIYWRCSASTWALLLESLARLFRNLYIICIEY